jgi:hypothetical protein
MWDMHIDAGCACVGGRARRVCIVANKLSVVLKFREPVVPLFELHNLCPNPNACEHATSPIGLVDFSSNADPG